MATLLAKGGPEGTIAQAQMQLGTMGIVLGAALGAGGVLNLTNGAWDSTAGLDNGPPNTVHIGDAYVEVGRLDPFALTLALGGLIGQTLREGFREGTEYDAHEGVRAALATALVHIPRDAFLGKSYLTGLKDLNEMLFSRDEATLGDSVSKHLSGIMTRLVPLGGESRQINDTLHGSAVEATTLTDQMLRTIPGAGIYAPVKRDILGDPVKGRLLGIAVGDSGETDGAEIGAVKAELRTLAIAVPNLRKADPAGFDLTAAQLDRLRELRGKIAVDDVGNTLPQALTGLFADEWYRGLPSKRQKRDAVLEVIRSFNDPARALLMDEDPTYTANREGWAAFKEYLADGERPEEARRAAVSDVLAEGLPEPQL
jgi:hypothetical protein